MKYTIAILGFSAAIIFVKGAITPIVPATSYIRAPAYDSAVIQSDRFGGNFAYSTLEGQAYQAITPVISNVVRPLSVQYQYNTAPITSLYVQQPILSSYPTYTIAEQIQIPNDGIASIVTSSNEEKREQEITESVTIEAAN